MSSSGYDSALVRARRAVERLHDCVAEFPDYPGAWEDRLDELYKAIDWLGQEWLTITKAELDRLQ